MIEVKPKVGDAMADGTIYAGVSPDTGCDMFVTPRDIPRILQWEAAVKYAAGIDANGHLDWKLPSIAELNVLFERRNKGALKDTFNEKGGWYWSSTEDDNCLDNAWMERFSDGSQGWAWKGACASVRPVRSEPQP